nr:MULTISPECIES: 30S ribosomal protein S3 [unclassified Exiguobacterium]
MRNKEGYVVGQKVNPHGLRVGIIKDWDSRWYAEKDYADLLHEDFVIREYIENKMKDASISKVEIERAANRVNISLHTAKPGMVIGKGGSEIESLRKNIIKLAEGKRVHINVVEVKNADAVAKLVAENIARQLEGRVSFRRAMKQSIQRSMRTGIKGIKTEVSGRLGGADIARSEKYSEGTVPLHTLRADIDYGTAEADTTYGKIGIKVWLYHGEVLPTKNNTAKNAE